MKVPKFWSFKNDNGLPKLYIYGIIDSMEWFGDEVTPNQFKTDLDALGDINELDVYINSDGGDVFAGQSIHSMLKRHPAKVNVYIDGLAASIASVIAMAGDVIYMPRNSMLMVHHPWTGPIWGNSAQFRKKADDLDNVCKSLIAAYQGKSGMDEARIIELLDAETWLSAEEAVACGLADHIEQEKEIAASLSKGIFKVNGQEMDLSKYKNATKFIFASQETKEPEPNGQEPFKSSLSFFEKIVSNNERVFM